MKSGESRERDGRRERKKEIGEKISRRRFVIEREEKMLVEGKKRKKRGRNGNRRFSLFSINWPAKPSRSRFPSAHRRELLLALYSSLVTF